jgi:hypothetical protein
VYKASGWAAKGCRWPVCTSDIEQLKGFINPKNPNYILKLNKALYKLKQLARI